MEHAAPGRACRRLWCDPGSQTANLFKVETPPRGASPAVDRSSPAKRRLLPERLGDAFLQSPTLRDVMLSAGTFKRARLVQEDAPFTAARQLLQQPSPTAAAKAQAFVSLAAATSSSRRSLDLACQTGQQQQQQEEQQGAQQQARLRLLQASPAATPVAPAAQPLPVAPRKRNLEGGRPAAARPLKSFCRRVLPGMGPASAADLQEVRAWLTALEAQ